MEYGFGRRRTHLRAQVRGLAIGCLMACAGGAAAGELHVPSPDWRDQIVYFLMIDRFDDGDPSNNDQGTGEYDPQDPARYSGGDLAGVTRRLDYVQGLGATAVWITPPVAHQWWNEDSRYGGYHGYWADDFSALDPHFGTLADYQALSRGLHGRGMYLIQDIVVNHTAHYFGYPDGWQADDPSAGFVRFADARGRKAPTQPPFDRNDARDPVQREDAIYHWTPAITDFTDRTQELTFQLADLDDLNTEHPDVRRTLRRSYGDWIRDVGVDAFRVDTALHVPADFFDDFLHSDDADAPGIVAAAQATGREDFHVFGEGFVMDRPFEDTQSRRLEAYMRTEDGRPRLPGMINFPLYGSLGDVFGRGEPTAVLGHRIASMVELHPRLHWMPSFVDNHDVDRFLAASDTRALRQALLAMMTLPGIPTLYYGTEQGFDGRRTAMFAGGVGARGRDAFDTDAALYREIAAMSALRLDDKVFTRGVPEVLRDTGGGPGALVWVTRHEDARALVAFNTADAPVLVDALETGLPAGTRLTGAFGLDGAPTRLEVDADGRLNLVLPPRAGLVWRADGQGTPQAADVGPAPRLDALPDGPWRDDVVLQGQAAPGDVLQLVVDGDLARAPQVRADAQGRWRATLRTDSWIDPAAEHRLVLWREADGATSAAQTFRVERQWTAAARLDDPAGDDHGPDGRYVYPEGGWRTHRQGDLRAVEVETSGGALRVTLRMAEVTRGWNPANGFDHVAPVLFVELPGREDGSAVMPLQNAQLPDGMRWHYRLRAHGWSNALFGADGAGPDHEGTPQPRPARLEVDVEAATLRFTLPASALGDPKTLSGTRVHAVTWDYDGGFRPLQPEASPSAFGGGDDARDPKVMDAAGPLRLP